MPNTLPQWQLSDWQRETAHGQAPTFPVILRGLVADWPIVAAQREDPASARALLRSFASPAPVQTMLGAPHIKGRFFYSEDMTGYNFASTHLPLPAVIDRIEAEEQNPTPTAIYAGSAPVDQHAARFAHTHHLPIATPGATPRLWVGNQTRVAAHYDVADNIAAVAIGRRRFTLFPPSATPYLYVGPLAFTIAGQPVSMVDHLAPDLDRFPLYPKALETALIADLNPGDAIFIPTLWWHHVEALDNFNLLVNYWHNHPPQGQPFASLVHAMLAVRDLPPEQRDAWRIWFDHFVFSQTAPHAADHLPEHARGLQGAPSPQRQAAIRDYLMSRISRY
jgi:hypothetical protein